MLTPEASHADAASESGHTLLSVASSVDETIYTPPETSPTRSTYGEDLEHVSSSSATAYFDLRPAYNRHTGPIEIYRLAISHDTDPKDILYPGILLAKDVTEQDWRTFINHLLPEHIAGVNNAIADRKLGAELEERVSRLSLRHDNRSRSDTSEAEAQLQPLRSPRTPRSSDRIESTISEWNDGFFNPRGVQISTLDVDAEIAASEEQRAQMPGSWIPAENENNGESSTNNEGARRGWGLGNLLHAGPQGFRMGPIVADNNGFRIGKNGLRADNEGFRIGNMLVADSNGFRLGGNRGFNAGNHGVSFAGRSLRGGEAPRDVNQQHRGRVHNGNHHRGRSHSHGRHGKQRQRSGSRSSTSSSSSSSSESSVGSLPAYEDLRDQQLPIAKQSLIAWLNHPEQPITRHAVQQARQDLNNARREIPRNVNNQQDAKELRAEVKELMKRFKAAKRVQKKQRREAKRVRKAEKRAAKRERKSARREERRGGQRGSGYHSGRGRRYGRGGPWGMGAGHLSPNMPVPPPTTPSFPFGNRGPFAQAGSSLGRGGFCGTRGPTENQRMFNGLTAMHGNWPFAQSNAYMPQATNYNDLIPSNTHYTNHSNPVSRSAEEIHAQLSEMSEAATRNENLAFGLRREATGHGLTEKEKARKHEEAQMLEEEAETCRREAGRLRAEAEAVDRELARELEEGNEHDREFGGQRSGVVPGTFT